MVDSYSPKNLVEFATVGTFVPDELVIYPGTVRAQTIASGQNVLMRGSVLGKVTATGKLVMSTAAATDGSQVPYAILAEDVDATSADADAVCYFEGMYNTNRLTLGAGHTLTSIFDPLREVDIELHTAMRY